MVAAQRQGPARREVHGTTDESTWEVTQLEENKTIEFSGESDKYIGYVGYELESTDGGTRLSYRMGGEVRSFLFKLMMSFMLPMASARSETTTAGSRRSWSKQSLQN